MKVQRSMRITSAIRFVFSITCVRGVCIVPVMYLFTLDDNVVVPVIDRPPLWILAAFMLADGVVIPSGLFLFLRDICRGSVLRRWFGLVAGTMYALWATTLLLTFPYVGAYPNIPAAVVGCLLSRDHGGPAFYLGAFATNMVLWPVAGWFFFKSMRQQKSQPRLT